MNEKEEGRPIVGTIALDGVPAGAHVLELIDTLGTRTLTRIIKNRRLRSLVHLRRKNDHALIASFWKSQVIASSVVANQAIWKVEEPFTAVMIRCTLVWLK